MSSAKRRLTSKNLFDDVFGAIPADSFLSYGPESLVEELAIQSFGETSTAARMRGGVVKGNGGGDGDDEAVNDPMMMAVRASDSTGPGTTSLSDGHTDTSGTIGSAASRWTMVGAARVGAGPLALRSRATATAGTATNPRHASAHGSSSSTVAPQRGMVLEIDAEDEAYREATKHAASLSEVRAAEAQMDAEAQARRRQRLADQVAALGAEEDRHTAGGGIGSKANHGGTSRGGERPGGMRHSDKQHQQQQQQHSLSSLGRSVNGTAGSASLIGDSGGGRVAGEAPGHPVPSSLWPLNAGEEGTANDAEVPGATAATGTVSGHHGDSTAAGMAASSRQLSDATMTGGLPTVRRQLSAEEQLTLMPPGLSLLYSGRCVMLRGGRGFGFIAPDIGGPDVYFIKDSIVLSFTRLALQAFYRRNGTTIPASTLLPEERWSPPDAARSTCGSLASAAASAAGAEPRVISSLNDLRPAAGVRAAGPSVEGPDNEKIEATDVNTATWHAAALGRSSTALSHANSSALELNPQHQLAATAASTQSSTCGGADSARGHMTSSQLDEGPLLPTPVAMGYANATLMANPGNARAPVPPITSAEKEKAERAASLLQHESAQLLQWAMDSSVGVSRGSESEYHNYNHNQYGSIMGSGHNGGEGSGGGEPGGVTVSVRDALTFTVHRNRATGGTSRLLRAEFIRGVPEAAFALPLEQCWFYPLFPGAIGAKVTDENPDGFDDLPKDGGGGGDNNANGATAAIAPVHTHSTVSLSPTSTAPPLLVRYSGSVRAYNAEDRRGYIRCDEADARQDVAFSSDAFLWDPAVPPGQRVITERMRVRYSVAGVDRNHRYLATLVTSSRDGRPFTRENIVYAEDEREGRGRRGGGGGGGDGGHGFSGGGGGDGGMGGTGGAKRTREEEEEQVLLFEEDDYAMI